MFPKRPDGHLSGYYQGNSSIPWEDAQLTFIFHVPACFDSMCLNLVSLNGYIKLIYIFFLTIDMAITHSSTQKVQLYQGDISQYHSSMSYTRYYVKPRAPNSLFKFNRHFESTLPAYGDSWEGRHWSSLQEHSWKHRSSA